MYYFHKRRPGAGKEFLMINFILERNELSGESVTYRAQVVNSRSYTFKDIANHLLQHNTGLSASVIYGVWEGIKGAVEEYIAEGGSINTELFQIHPSIQGVFDAPEDGFDRSRHTIRLRLKAGALLREIPKKLAVRKNSSSAKSYILSVTDIKSGAVNDSITVGKNIRISGKKLKIEGDDPTCGLYFVPEKNNVDPVKVETSEVVVNKPSQIIAVVPKLGKGTWNLRLVTQFSSGSKFRKRTQSLVFNKSLTVA